MYQHGQFCFSVFIILVERGESARQTIAHKVSAGLHASSLPSFARSGSLKYYLMAKIIYTLKNNFANK
jgi:hypothetical protein